MNNAFRHLNIGLPEDILRLKYNGNFEEAIRLIDRRLAAENIPKSLRDCLTVQKEICRRLPSDYPYTRSEALAEARARIPDFSEEEFDNYTDSGKIGWIFINGEKHFFNRFFETLYKTDEKLASRIINFLPGDEVPNPDNSGAELLDRTMRLMKKNGSVSRRITIRASVKMNEEFFSPGMFIRAHLPIPAECEQQSDIVIERIYPGSGQLSPLNAPQRTVCWEESMETNHEFYVEYSYTHKAEYHDAYNLNTSQLRGLLHNRSMAPEDIHTFEEAPHIVYTPYIRSLAAELTEGLTEPLEKARAFYDFITKNMNYTFMPQYFVLENIPESCARNYTGDCGVFALLFITLCRCAGIPAHWQSGLSARPDSCGAHDWVRFYIKDAGWLYADPSFGISACRMGAEERRQFYFGNLDAFRMVSNNAFQADFTVPKKYWRADPYDNQVGEIETGERGLRYDEFIRTKEVLECV